MSVARIGFMRITTMVSGGEDSAFTVITAA